MADTELSFVDASSLGGNVLNVSVDCNQFLPQTRENSTTIRNGGITAKSAIGSYSRSAATMFADLAEIAKGSLK